MFDLLTYTLRTYTYMCLSIQIYLPVCISEISSVPSHFSDTTRSPKQSHEPFNKGRQENSVDVVIAAWPRHFSLGPVLLNIDVRQVAPLQERRTSQSWLYRSSCFAVRRVRYCLLLWRTEAGQRSTHSRTKDSSTYFHEPAALSRRHCCASKHVSLLVPLSLWRAGKRGSSRLLKLLWEQRWHFILESAFSCTLWVKNCGEYYVLWGIIHLQFWRTFLLWY